MHQNTQQIKDTCASGCKTISEVIDAQMANFRGMACYQMQWINVLKRYRNF